MARVAVELLAQFDDLFEGGGEWRIVDRWP
jgi:hypothetical protein